MQLKTNDLRPSVVLQYERWFGTYDRAVAWLACHGGWRLSEKSETVVLVADLYGVEPGQVAHDAKMARKREKAQPRNVKSIREQRLFYTTV